MGQVYTGCQVRHELKLIGVKITRLHKRQFFECQICKRIFLKDEVIGVDN